MGKFYSIVLLIFFFTGLTAGDYSKIREELLLPADFTTRTVDLEELKADPFITERIDRVSDNARIFAYSSEGVDDTEWGCAWRAIQTSLSPYQTEVPGFVFLFTNFGTREFIEKQMNELYGPYDKKWLAPQEDWHMWADPFVGKMILHDYGIEGKLVAVNKSPQSNSPEITDVNVAFPIFKQMLLSHFALGKAPVMVDNGLYSLNIVGVGESKERFFLLVADPHLILERDDHPLNGLYIVELDERGEQVAVDYPAAHNHFDPGSYQTFRFSPDTKWLTLFPGLK